MKKTNWVEVAAGAALMLGVVADVVPGDELLGMPLGALLVAHGFGVV